MRRRPPRSVPHALDGRVPGTEAAGTGIGLAVARQLVEAHGGDIRCESKQGQGTTFAFTLSPG